MQYVYSKFSIKLLIRYHIRSDTVMLILGEKILILRAVMNYLNLNVHYRNLFLRI